MKDSLYIGLSAQMAIEKRMETLADNVANVNTVGFRATRVRFEQALSKTDAGENVFVKEGGTYIDTRPGALVETGNSLDFAINGNAWFGIRSGAGTVLTRDGRFTLGTDGQLQTLNGDLVIDAGGAPIQVDGAAGPLQAGQDGVLYQNGKIVGSIGLFGYEPVQRDRPLGRFGDRSDLDTRAACRPWRYRCRAGLHRRIERRSRPGDDAADLAAAPLRIGQQPDVQDHRQDG